MRLLSLWADELDAMGRARYASKGLAREEDIRRIERLVAFVDSSMPDDADGNDHPLSEQITNWAPWNVKRLAALSDDLLTVARSAKGFDRVRRPLAQRDHYHGAVLEISLAAEFLRGGLHVTFNRETKALRTSDLLLEWDGGRLYVEISRIGQSAASEEIFSYLDHENWDRPEFKGVDISIELYRFVSRPRRREILDRLALIAADVKATGEDRSYTARGLLHAQLRKAEDPSRVGLGVRGYPLDQDEVGRLIRIIRNKSHQLPTGEPGMLILIDEELTPSPTNRPKYGPLVRELEEYVFECPQMTSVLMVLPFGDPDAEAFSARGKNWAAWRKLGPGFLVQDRVLVLNRYASLSLDERVVTALNGPPNLRKMGAGN